MPTPCVQVRFSNNRQDIWTIQRLLDSLDKGEDQKEIIHRLSLRKPFKFTTSKGKTFTALFVPPGETQQQEEPQSEGSEDGQLKLHVYRCYATIPVEYLIGVWCQDERQGEEFLDAALKDEAQQVHDLGTFHEAVDEAIVEYWDGVRNSGVYFALGDFLGLAEDEVGYHHVINPDEAPDAGSTTEHEYTDEDPPFDP